jgi:RimJ/RimL family protein N-acetyltransferase
MTAGPPIDAAVNDGIPTLEGRWVRLEPLRVEHALDLLPALQDEDVCRYLLWAPLRDAQAATEWVEHALAAARAGQCVPFATIERASGRAIGSTRLLDLAPADRRVEIGSTFLDRAHWRSAANTESKWLLLRHCFEQRGCLRVALKTDGRNLRSQAAIERLGAQREGVLRRHMRVHGYQRDTVYYSILADEWPSVRQRLEQRLSAAPAAT